MFTFAKGKPLPDYGLFGVYKRFQRIAIQQTSKCHNRCIFCPVTHMKHLPQGSMPVKDLEFILRSIPSFSGEVALATDGESFLLDDLPERCALIKSYWPNSTISLISTFNLDKGPSFVERLFASGLSLLSISCYGYTADDYKKVHGYDGFWGLQKNIGYLKKIPNDRRRVSILQLDGSHEIFSLGEEAETEFFSFAAASGVTIKEKAPLHSWQNRVPFGAQGKRSPIYPCSVVWGGRARQLQVSWDLNILPCCMFAGQEYVFGNMRKSSLEEIFGSLQFRSFYEKHWNGDLADIPLCNICTSDLVNSNEREVARLAAYQASLLAGGKVYFWGAGETYKSYSIFFRAVHPEAILLDTDERPDEIDGIPVKHPDECLISGEKLPIVIFAYGENSSAIIDKIKNRYARYASNDLVLCPADRARLVE